jgi:hypothetical protein
MLTQFLKAAKGTIIWLVIPNAVVTGKLTSHLTQQNQIAAVMLKDVSVSQGGAETALKELIVPTFSVSAWGSDDDAFNHLTPDQPD